MTEKKKTSQVIPQICTEAGSSCLPQTQSVGVKPSLCKLCFNCTGGSTVKYNFNTVLADFGLDT